MKLTVKLNLNYVKEFINKYENKAELARNIKISESTLSKIMDGKRNAGLKVLIGILEQGAEIEKIFIIKKDI